MYRRFLILFILLCASICIANPGWFSADYNDSTGSIAYEEYGGGGVDCTGLDWYWNISDGTDMIADCYDATDGNTISGSSTYLTSGTGFDGGYGLEITSDPGAINAVRFVCTAGNNINIGEFTIEFYYKETDAASSYATFFRHSSASTALILRRSAASDTTIELYYGATLVNITTGAKNVFDGSEHHCKLVISDSANTEVFYVDDMVTPVFSGSTSVTAPALASGSLYLGSHSDGTSNMEGVMSEFKIY